MVKWQVTAVYKLMLKMVLDRTDNHITRYMAEHILNPFVGINEGNLAYEDPVDIKLAARIELERYLDVGINGLYDYLHKMPKSERLKDLQGYDSTVEAVDELRKIWLEVIKINNRDYKCEKHKRS